MGIDHLRQHAFRAGQLDDSHLGLAGWTNRQRARLTQAGRNLRASGLNAESLRRPSTELEEIRAALDQSH